MKLWPRVGTIVMNDTAFAALSETQREALRRAGREALDPALARLERDEHTALVAICPAAPHPGSFRLVSATPRDLAALRTAVAPLYRRLDRGVIAAIEAMKTDVASALACPGASRRPQGAGALRLSTVLARTDKTTWKGTVTSKPLGRGRLQLRVRGGLALRGRVVRHSGTFEARFARGTLRGCIGMAAAPLGGGDYRWTGGPGTVKTASRGLRRYAGLSLRFAGRTGADDLRHVAGVFVTDAPNGLPCCELRVIAVSVALLAAGCGGGGPPTLDGVYRASVSARDLVAIDAPGESAANWGAWTLVLNRGRFALTQESDQVCAWIYGALTLGKGNSMDWTVIDAGAAPAGAASTHPGDRYRFAWTRYRDVLTLSAPRRGTAGYFGAKPWRRVARSDASTRCPPPAGALVPTGAERVRPASGTALRITGDLTRTMPTRWEGPVSEPKLGRGRLTIDGTVRFAPTATRSRLTFAARFGAGELRGCAITTVLPRPRGRYLWTGGGQVTATSPALRAYRGLAVDTGGVTTADDLTHMRGGLEPAAPEQLC